MHTLQTDRLILHPLSDTDFEWFLELNSTPFVRQYLWDDALIDGATVDDILAQNARHFREDGYGLWKMSTREGQDAVGYVGLWFFFDEVQPQLLYAISEQFTGNGYATEAAKAVMNYAFDRLGFTYLIAATDEPHVSSQKVARRLGFQWVETKEENGKRTSFFRLDKQS